MVYGYKCHSLKEPNNDFVRFGMKAFDFGRFNLIFAMFYPEILHKITLPLFRRNVGEFCAKIFYETVEYRRKNNVQRQDFLNLLIQLVNNGELEDDVKHNNCDNEVKRKHKMIIYDDSSI